MYRYNAEDQRLLDQRVVEFRDQTTRFLGGALSEDRFRPLRLLNGLYLQRYAPMLRVLIPYGLLESRQLRGLAEIARRYDRGYGHFSTRQNIQFNWIRVDECPDVLETLAALQMHCIQSSGNSVRNITADPLAGVSPDEVADPRPYCELIRQWSTLHPEFTWLPRKFKFAVAGSDTRRVGLRVHDVGVRLMRDAAGEIALRIYVGGGLGRTPIVAPVIHEALPRRHMLSYLAAILRVYNLEGRRDNRYKARIKILVKQLGIEAFRARVEEEWAPLRDALEISDAQFAQMERAFAPLPYASQEATAPLAAAFGAEAATQRAFDQWRARNTRAHRMPGYRVVCLSLKGRGQTPGNLDAARMDAVADLADRFSFGQIRATQDQNLLLTDVREQALPTLWESLRQLELATPNIDTLADIICCPGMTYCSLADAHSAPVAKRIQERFKDEETLEALGKIHLNISGCINACGHHHIGDIGILGLKKGGEERYQLTVGGESGESAAALGKRLGASLSMDETVDAVAALVAAYRDRREAGESFADAVRRVGIAPFQQAVYAPNTP